MKSPLLLRLCIAASTTAAPAKVTDTALQAVGMKGEAAALTKQALLRNLDIASKLGCLDTFISRNIIVTIWCLD